MSCLDVQVSFYKNCYDAVSSETIDLNGFLDNDIYKQDVTEIRLKNNPTIVKRMKLALPCVTVSGVFRKRCSTGLLKHSGLLGIDIDANDNPHISSFDELRSRLTQIKNVAYCGRSVYSGYFAIIPISHPEKHSEHFIALKTYFKTRHSLIIDPHCGNVDRLRTISFDENRYFNYDAIPFSAVLPSVPRGLSTRIPINTQRSVSSVRQLQDAVLRISKMGLDITGNEYDWWRIGCSIVSVLGEDGRSLFHNVSRYYKNGKHRYTAEETDKKYDQCMNSESECTIGTFFWYLRKALEENKL